VPAVLAATLLLPATAGATSAYVDDGVIHVLGTDARDNLEVRYGQADRPVIAVRALFQTVDAGPGCTRVNDDVTCPYDGSRAVDVALGAGDDEFIADVGLPLTVHAGDGKDRLSIYPGNSPTPTAPATLDGGEGTDRIAGGPGNDVILGGAGDDGLEGGTGNDRIDGGPGQDVISDVAGDDTIEGRDGEADNVRCGPGTDTGDFDAFDDVRGCELGDIPPPVPSDCTPEFDPVTVVAWSHLRRVRAMTIRATAEDGCVLRGRIAIGSGSVLTAAPARSGAVRLALGPRALRRIRAARRFRVSILSTPQGTTRTIRRTFTVRVRVSR
jgi:hypothetical protein